MLLGGVITISYQRQAFWLRGQHKQRQRNGENGTVCLCACVLMRQSKSVMLAQKTNDKTRGSPCCMGQIGEVCVG